ncbi:hypothetical protein PIB30_037763 [Stylosanthes scabra]|uniref:Aminotransferase-like plant mobile domain-containing protein n=1 Tax=Stylosanthes scabra TaxID=79078 RepID=A0ABU6UDL2_9FABA|nr:hypothetical protein [Stylosanthes scabra]
MLELRHQLDRIAFDEFVWTPYALPAWRDIEPDWVHEDGETETWRAVVPLLLFMYARFHHVDQVKRQFGSEQPIPADPVNLDGFFTVSARGDDKWWPNELQYWYELWNNRRAGEHQIQIVQTTLSVLIRRSTLIGGLGLADDGTCPRMVCFEIPEGLTYRMMSLPQRPSREIT